ncbi:MAG: carbon-nitrogen hydrolase family protein, partial [Defluviitaleaceae bacterium]|nr:carbon-nitrogen hydrolase family protein [Defluviitaleaceae bacterium]
TIVNNIKRAVSDKAELVLFPEMALSGVNLSNNFHRDVKLAVPLESPYIKEIQAAAKNHEIWVALGFLERDGLMLYDSAIMINDLGEVVLHYRAISDSWSLPNAPPNYGVGDNYPTLHTPWGKMGFLIHEDIFDITHIAFAEQLDMVLCPVACCFSKAVYIDPQQDWDKRFWPHYERKLSQVGAVALMSNYICKLTLYHGGAFITDKQGKLIASTPLYEEGLLSGIISLAQRSN